MPLFYFHHQRRGELLRDPDGSEVRDVVAARDEALSAARELWSSAILRGSDLTDDTFVIAEEATGFVLLVPFIDALPERLRSSLAKAYRHGG